MHKASKINWISSILAFFLATESVLADGPQTEDTSSTVSPPSIGNFIFPSSQQPGPLVGFGQNIIDKHETQLFLYGDYFNKKGGYSSDFIPSLLYGITDNFSIFLNLPVAIGYKNGSNQSSGLEDAFVQFEYAFYARQTREFSEQATVVTNMTFPTGSSTKNPPTGSGSPNFFLGATYNRTYVDWFGFTSYGVVIPTSENNTQFGNQFLYQAGLGRNILDVDKQWIFAWVLEATGQYAEQSATNGGVNTATGGNIVYLTPSLWISSKNLIIQPGISFPVIQHLYGNQLENNYALVLNLGWTF